MQFLIPLKTLIIKNYLGLDSGSVVKLKMMNKWKILFTLSCFLMIVPTAINFILMGQYTFTALILYLIALFLGTLSIYKGNLH